MSTAMKSGLESLLAKVTSATPLPVAVIRPTGPLTLSIHPIIGSLIDDITAKKKKPNDEDL